MCHASSVVLDVPDVVLDVLDVLPTAGLDPPLPGPGLAAPDAQV